MDYELDDCLESLESLEQLYINQLARQKEISTVLGVLLAFFETYIFIDKPFFEQFLNAAKYSYFDFIVISFSIIIIFAVASIWFIHHTYDRIDAVRLRIRDVQIKKCKEDLSKNDGHSMNSCFYMKDQPFYRKFIIAQIAAGMLANPNCSPDPQKVCKEVYEQLETLMAANSTNRQARQTAESSPT